MRRTSGATVTLLLALLWIVPAGATTIVRVADAELVAEAPRAAITGSST